MLAATLAALLGAVGATGWGILHRRRTRYPVLEGPTMERARRRVRGLGAGELLDWLDAAGTGMYRASSRYRSSGDQAALEEMTVGATGIVAILDELRRRAETTSH